MSDTPKPLHEPTARTLADKLAELTPEARERVEARAADLALEASRVGNPRASH